MKTSFFLVGAFLVPCTAASQVYVSGTVVDSTGAPVPLVVVSAGDRSVMTDSEGSFRLSGLAAGAQTLTLRRIGYEERTVLVSAPGDNLEYVVGNIVLRQLATVLDEITVEALAPIMTQRGINAFNFARREGVARYFFTAYDIARLQPFDIVDIARFVPGGSSTFDPLHGNVIRMTSRGSVCTASISIDGVSTRNPNPNAFLNLDRIGALWFTPRGCSVEVWTKPIPVGDTSPFELGLRAGTGFRDTDGFGMIGGYLAAPIAGGRVELVPGFDAGVNNAGYKWQIQFAARFRLLHSDQPWYVGAGVSFVEEAVRALADPTNSTSDILLGGLSLDLGPLRPFVELQVADLLTAGPTRARLYSGLGYRSR